MIIISSKAHHASSGMNLPLALLIFLFWGVVLGSSSAPAAFDWRNNNGTNYVTSVKNQNRDRCDNSWAFAAVSVVESALLIKGGWPQGGLDLSEQQVLDCGRNIRTERGGCFLGEVKEALRFITTRGGLSRELDYLPYTGLNTGFCWNLWVSNVSTQGLLPFLQVYGNEDQLAQALATDGPLAVSICTLEDMNLYNGGIYNNLACIDSCYGGISMTLVGYGTEDGIPYWTLKNSWGRAWGERGFLRLARGYNRCGIATHPAYLIPQ